MDGRIIFGNGAGANTTCFPEAPDLGGCGPSCDTSYCTPCTIAPCKTRLRDAQRMKPRELERAFVLTEFGCDGTQIPLAVVKVGMTLRRRGDCCVIDCLAPIRTTLDGAAVFRWSDLFLSQPPGQYEGDVSVNGCEVGSVLLIKPDQAVSVEVAGVTEQEFACASDACAPCACSGPIGSCPNCTPCGDYAELDGEYESDQSACGGCETC